MRTVTVSFTIAERMLADVLAAVPYCPEHENVWSPALATILLDVGSQLDSLWKHELQSRPTATKKPDIQDYFKQLGPALGPGWLVLWGDEGERVQPFRDWDGLKSYAKADHRHHRLPWWDAYNAVKHDRIANRKQATLKTTTTTLAGLFVSMFRCPTCWNSLWQEDWVPAETRQHYEPQKLLQGASPIGEVIAESRLLSYPINSGRGYPITWVGRGTSYRFGDWCDRNKVRYL